MDCKGKRRVEQTAKHTWECFELDVPQWNPVWNHTLLNVGVNKQGETYQKRSGKGGKDAKGDSYGNMFHWDRRWVAIYAR